MKIRGIVNRKVKDGVTMYKVKYKGDMEDAWLMADEVDEKMIEKFEAKRAGKMEKKPQEVKQEKRQLDAPAEKAAKAVKSSPSEDASSASRSRGSEDRRVKTEVVAPADLKPAVFRAMKKYLETAAIESLTKKKVRRLLEKELGVSEMSLEERKQEIGAATDAFLEQHDGETEEQHTGGDDAESSDSEDESSEEEAEKAPVKKPTSTIITKTGAEVPKNIAKLQRNAMKVKYFEANAEPLAVNVLGNAATGEPRSFSSGNRGWYIGGKIEVTVGKKKLWAQLGLNLTILGSKEWS